MCKALDDWGENVAHAITGLTFRMSKAQFLDNFAGGP